MKKDNNKTSRRDALKTFGLLGLATTLGHSSEKAYAEDQKPGEKAETFSLTTSTVSSRAGFLEALKKQIAETPMVDSHEHLSDEADRLIGKKSWVTLFQHYFGDDFAASGLADASVFGSPQKDADPVELWRRLEPAWFAVKNTGYGQAARISIRELYGIDNINEDTIPLLQERYEESFTPGLYERILREHANIETCQVDSGSFRETRQPELLLQDINFCGFQTCGEKEVRRTIARTGTSVDCLSDWHDAIRIYFQKYGPYATAVKSQLAYSRGLDYEQVPAEKAEVPFKKRLEDEPLTPEETKLYQDHLFWFCVDQANQYELPVKLHTGYYVGTNSMPLSRLSQNPAQLTDLCLRSRQTRWMFMHTCYPYSRELIAIAKQFTNANVQTCWAWIIDPVGTKNFLKQFLVTAPANKIHVFGGDYQNVENVLGHAQIARHGVFSALAELVDEGYVSQDDALELVEPLLRGNAHRIFQLEKKYALAKNVPWK